MNKKFNTEVIAHPRLEHYGLVTANMDAMAEWYRKVLGMNVNHRSEVPEEVRKWSPFSAATFVGNDEVDHRIVFFEVKDVATDPDRQKHTRMQHVAFESPTLDDLLGTYIRLKEQGIMPVWAADHGVGTSIYWIDPDGNNVEIFVKNYSTWETATEHIKTMEPKITPLDVDKLVEAREAGASPWEIHQRAIAGEFSPKDWSSMRNIGAAF